ncbi:MAG: hypothetical protein HY332_09965 [Chloroflexi bacterium]|nr:hypothetical protein [Chloroflexota bacterium]
MAVKDRPGLQEIMPGLYVSTDQDDQAKLTREFADAVRRISGSNVLAELIEEAIRKQEQRESARKKA